MGLDLQVAPPRSSHKILRPRFSKVPCNKHTPLVKFNSSSAVPRRVIGRVSYVDDRAVGYRRTRQRTTDFQTVSAPSAIVGDVRRSSAGRSIHKGM
jgi:hypothetical protein